jgi:predicted transport protein
VYRPADARQLARPARPTIATSGRESASPELVIDLTTTVFGRLVGQLAQKASEAGVAASRCSHPWSTTLAAKSPVWKVAGDVADIKLFRTASVPPVELDGRSAALERSLQNLIEQHLDVFLGVRFLASEYPTGKKHRGRIDTLGLDENNSPVIIEYKRSTGENVINQGLFYLDWLLDHQAEFEVLAIRALGPDATVEWSAPRLLCIAGDFTRYDEHAVEQINRSIELIRYRQYGTELLLFELVNAPGADGQPPAARAPSGGPSSEKTVADYLAQAPQTMVERYQTLEAFALSLGDDVTKKELKSYFAFRRLKNFACIEVHPGGGHLLVYVKVDPDEVDLVAGVLRDVRRIGHFGTGDLEVRITADEHLEVAKEMIARSYDVS